MKNLFKFEKRIVDERMELQSLKNTRKSFNLVVILLGFVILAELYLLRWDFSYIFPSFCVLMAVCFHNLFLEIRDGNIYTSENSDRKKVMLIYLSSSLATGLIVAAGTYAWRKALWLSAILFLTVFLLTFSLTLVLDAFVGRMERRQSEKGAAPESDDEVL